MSEQTSVASSIFDKVSAWVQGGWNALAAPLSAPKEVTFFNDRWLVTRASDSPSGAVTLERHFEGTGNPGALNLSTFMSVYAEFSLQGFQDHVKANTSRDTAEVAARIHQEASEEVLENDDALLTLAKDVIQRFTDKEIQTQLGLLQKHCSQNIRTNVTVEFSPTEPREAPSVVE